MTATNITVKSDAINSFWEKSPFSAKYIGRQKITSRAIAAMIASYFFQFFIFTSLLNKCAGEFPGAFYVADYLFL